MKNLVDACYERRGLICWGVIAMLLIALVWLGIANLVKEPIAPAVPAPASTPAPTVIAPAPAPSPTSIATPVPAATPTPVWVKSPLIGLVTGADILGFITCSEANTLVGDIFPTTRVKGTGLRAFDFSEAILISPEKFKTLLEAVQPRIRQEELSPKHKYVFKLLGEFMVPGAVGDIPVGFAVRGQEVIGAVFLGTDKGFYTFNPLDPSSLTRITYDSSIHHVHLVGGR